MKVSICLATYNGEKFIEKQLNSILNQTMPFDEVIIFDDKSTDGTPELVKKFIFEHCLNWNFVQNQNNLGYKKNFKQALSKATGDIVFLCDQDDIWNLNKVEFLLDIFAKNSDVLAINTSFEIVDQNDEAISNCQNKGGSNNGLISQKLKSELTKIDINECVIKNISPGCTAAFKKQIVDEYLTTTECLMPHDWELNIIAARRNGLFFLDIPLIKYRIHGGNAIGLPIGKTNIKFKMQGSTDTRFKIFGEQKAQCEQIGNNLDFCSNSTKKLYNKYSSFCVNREKILNGKKFTACFKNLLLYPFVKRVGMVNFRGILGDFVFALKNK